MKKKLLYWIPTGLLCLQMAGSGITYFFNLEMVAEVYQTLGFPVWVLYFNGVAKILGAIAILAPVERFLKEFAYAGYLYIILLGLIAHVVIADGMQWGAVAALVFWVLSYWQYRVQKA